jgi:hypothetical protein
MPAMKRILIFTLLLPPLALVVLLWREMFADGHWRLPPMDFVLTAYLVATIPAWLSAAVDWGLSVKLSKLRVVGTTVAAFVIAVVYARVIGHDFGLPSFLSVGLMGAIPAAVCSLLSRGK